MAGIRKIRYYNQTGPVIGMGFRLLLDLTEHYERPIGFSLPEFSLPEFSLVPLDPVERAAAKEVPLDVRDYLARVEATQREYETKRLPFDRQAVANIIDLLKRAVPPPLPPARTRTRNRAGTALLTAAIEREETPMRTPVPLPMSQNNAPYEGMPA